jgi:hypothetical protein
MAQCIITNIHAYLHNQIVANSEQQVSTEKLIMEIYGESLPVMIMKIVVIEYFYAPEVMVSII